MFLMTRAITWSPYEPNYTLTFFFFFFCKEKDLLIYSTKYM